MEKQIVRQGFVAITPTICQGDTMAWTTEDDDGNDIPVVEETKEKILEEIEEDEDSEDFPAVYRQYADGSIKVTDENDEFIIFETTISEWRASR